MKKFKKHLFLIVIINMFLITACSESYDLYFGKHSELGGVMLTEFPDEIIGRYKSEIDDDFVWVRKNYVQFGEDSTDFLYLELHLSDSLWLYKHYDFYTLRSCWLNYDDCTIAAIIPSDSMKVNVKIFTAPDLLTIKRHVDEIPLFELSSEENTSSTIKNFKVNPDSILFREWVLNKDKFFNKSYKKLSSQP
jgi:hypothetical protein